MPSHLVFRHRPAPSAAVVVLDRTSYLVQLIPSPFIMLINGCEALVALSSEHQGNAGHDHLYDDGSPVPALLPSSNMSGLLSSPLVRAGAAVFVPAALLKRPVNPSPPPEKPDPEGTRTDPREGPGTQASLLLTLTTTSHLTDRTETPPEPIDENRLSHFLRIT